MHFTHRFPRALTHLINAYFVFVVGYWLLLQLLDLAAGHGLRSVVEGIFVLTCGLGACLVQNLWERNRTRRIVTAYDRLSSRHQAALLAFLDDNDETSFKA